MTPDNRNMIIAIVLSIVVVFGWQYLVAGPQLNQAQKQAQIQQQQAAQTETTAGNAASTSTATPTAGTPTQTPASGATSFPTREAALAASPRVEVDTPALAGSISLTGARIDDLELKDYHETVDPSSPIITLLNPSGGPEGYYIEQGWVPAPDGKAAVPGADTVWTVSGDNNKLTTSTPVTLTWDNGQGLTFTRTIAVDDHYLFTVTQSVANASATPVSLYRYSRIVRQGTPKVQNYFVQHEGPLGILGSNNLVSKKYTDLQNDAKNGNSDQFNNTSGWIGMTDKYWATTVIADPKQSIDALFVDTPQAGQDVYQTSFAQSAPTVVPPGGNATETSYVFAGAKKETLLEGYQKQYGFDRLDLLIDWGWLFFLTRPIFDVLQFIYGFLGNFGLAILLLTVCVKALLFPLANHSYASMAAMRRVQPEMKAIQERLKEDRAAQQQAIMELYRKEKINPLSGCWPIAIQIPVFFSLYSVLFISLEMRHAPFFGWINDLASPDPTNIFTLFGLIPWDPTMVPFIGGLLHLGVWPLVMGVTMWLQMRLNPPPADPTQAMIFNWMPVFFTFMLGSFPAGLVIYWAWNNTLSVTQQYIIMKRHGADVNLFGNILTSLGIKRESKAG